MDQILKEKLLKYSIIIYWLINTCIAVLKNFNIVNEAIAKEKFLFEEAAIDQQLFFLVKLFFIILTSFILLLGFLLLAVMLLQNKWLKSLNIILIAVLFIDLATPWFWLFNEWIIALMHWLFLINCVIFYYLRKMRELYSVF